MIETMNEQQVKLANCMREYDLLHETLGLIFLNLMLIYVMMVRLLLL